MEKRRVVLTCEWCGKDFETIPSHAARRRYCSVECAGKGRKDECNDTRRCAACNRLFTVKRWDKQITCGKRCADALKVKRVTKRCEVCDKEYEAHWNRRNVSRFCSLDCLARAKRKVRRRPTRDALAGLLVHHTLVRIGEMYGVTANAVRYWCRCYDLAWPNKAERSHLQRLKPRERDAIVEWLLTNDCQHRWCEIRTTEESSMKLGG